MRCKSCGHSTPADSTTNAAPVKCEPCGSPLPAALPSDDNELGHSE